MYKALCIYKIYIFLYFIYKGKFKMKLRGIGVKFEFAEWIEKN